LSKCTAVFVIGDRLNDWNGPRTRSGGLNGLNGPLYLMEDLHGYEAGNGGHSQESN
jgi:hypothetical protein